MSYCPRWKLQPCVYNSIRETTFAKMKLIFLLESKSCVCIQVEPHRKGGNDFDGDYHESSVKKHKSGSPIQKYDTMMI